jgi:outer membrane protein assembly factor BamB
VLWTRQFGLGSTEHAKAITTDASGTIYVAGQALYILDGETDPERIGGAFVRTYGAQGDLKGSFQLKTIGGASEIMAIAVHGSELVIAGSQGSDPSAPEYTARDLFVRRIDVTGNAVWGDVLNGKEGPNENSFDSACGVAADGEGNTVLLGQLNGRLEGVSSRAGVVVRKYGPTGAPLWTKFFENAGCAVNSGALRVAADGHIYVVASPEIRKLAPNGDVLWTKNVFPLGPSCAALAPSALIVAGFTRDVPDAEGDTEDIFVRKYDLEGNELWTRQVGSPGRDAPYALDVDSAGRIYIGGRSMSYGSLPHLLDPAAAGAFLMQMKP